jgi:hypothetical protein
LRYTPRPINAFWNNPPETSRWRNRNRQSHVYQLFNCRCGVIDSRGARIFEARVAHPQELHIRAMRSSPEPVRLFSAPPGFKAQRAGSQAPPICEATCEVGCEAAASFA